MRFLQYKPHKHRSGFSLIETAIVLGVVGVIIGGIWTAASAVNEKKRQADTLTDVLMIVESTRGMFRNMSATASLNPMLINAGIVPQDLVAGSTIKNRWNGTITANINTGQNRVYLTLSNVPKASCVQVVMQLSARTEVKTLVNNNSCYVAYTTLSLTDAATLCDQPLNSINWNFPLGSGNITMPVTPC